jgi:hypothetical protein
MLTINADDHALMRNFHKPDDEKLMVVILEEEDYDAWLTVFSSRPTFGVRELAFLPSYATLQTCAANHANEILGASSLKSISPGLRINLIDRFSFIRENMRGVITFRRKRKRFALLVSATEEVSTRGRLYVCQPAWILDLRAARANTTTSKACDGRSARIVSCLVEP